MSNKRILITRLLGLNSTLKNWALQNNYLFLEKAFIRFEKSKNVVIPQTDWIFFSSPNGVKIYLESYKIQAKKIAALSSGTAKELEGNKFKVDFIGQSNQSTTEIALALKKEINQQEKVLFPLSSISKKNISNQLKAEQKIEIEIYKTLPIKDQVSDELAAIIFTSPSNAQGFFSSNKLAPSTHIVAIGQSTKMEVERHTTNSINVADSYDENGIIRKLNALLFG